eukprot:CAMPEP_0198143062 /NCGR_PEP_ID=MMETSP1443-20131203/5677_1 /TAXON_ID=186043 /ORGANISM="Entomoneis sp., Strain CCMP2396" /LENGTH=193 /DNA_ID=CAMNT_0043806201 /DNA_START=210 /DNA_END=791 /DNA_ORIENTATION=+
MPLLAISLYLSSFVGDAVDGWVARKLNQTSTFGGVLDMVTDRCATVGLLQILTARYLQQGHRVKALAFVFVAALDISSHWCQMYASCTCLKAHHKSAEANQDANFLVRWYYRHFWFFAYLCVGAEVTFVLSYADLYLENLPPFLFWVCLPACAAKQVVNVAQLTSACRAIAQQDADKHNEQSIKDETRHNKES